MKKTFLTSIILLAVCCACENSGRNSVESEPGQKLSIDCYLSHEVRLPGYYSIYEDDTYTYNLYSDIINVVKYGNKEYSFEDALAKKIVTIEEVMDSCSEVFKVGK